MALTRTRPPGPSAATSTALSTPDHALRANALGFPTILAESIGLISPTMTAVLIIPIAFSYAGQGTWLTYAFGTVMLIFVVLCLNQFAKRTALPGSMYGYTAGGSGRRPVCSRAGASSGLPLHWCRRADGLRHLRPAVPVDRHRVDSSPVFFFLLSAAGCWLIAYQDIHVSSPLTLVIEALSVACIAVLAFIILFKHGLTVDTAS